MKKLKIAFNRYAHYPYNMKLGNYKSKYRNEYIYIRNPHIYQYKLIGKLKGRYTYKLTYIKKTSPNYSYHIVGRTYGFDIGDKVYLLENDKERGITKI